MLINRINRFKYFSCLIAHFIGCTIVIFAQEIELKDQLIGKYTLDGEVKDLSGHKNHGDLYSGSLEQDRLGKPSGAVAFGRKTFIKISSSFPQIENEVSVALWLLSEEDSIQTLVSKYQVKDGVGNGFRMLVENGKVVFGGRDGSTHYRSSGASNTIVNDSIWHFIVGICRGGNWEIWVDGKKENEYISDYKFVNISNGQSLLIGNSPQLKEHFFSGLIDDLSIYSRALNETEIKLLYKNGELTAKEEVEIRVASSISLWEKRGTYEKTTDYLDRVNPSTRLIKREELTEAAIQELGQSRFNWQYLTHNYDADTENLTLNFEGFEPYILDLPIEAARHYDLANFHLLGFDNVKFGLTEKGNLKIVRLDIMKSKQKARR